MDLEIFGNREPCYAVFGAGVYGKKALELLGKDNICFFIDNSTEKQKNGFEGLSVISFDEYVDAHKDIRIIVAVSEKYFDEIVCQLKEAGIDNFCTANDARVETVKRKILARVDYISIYKKAIEWIHNHTIENEGIINSTILPKSYPEVSGYYIPTLLRWGYKELALSYAKWLCAVQHEEGAWYDTTDSEPYVFDTAQVLKGLLSVRKYLPEVDKHIIKGCDWLLSNMTDEGRLVSPLKDTWGDGKMMSELIHTYCISPIREAGSVFKRQDYTEKADLMIAYYTTKCREQILNYHLLSHFYAYVMEAMLDIGQEELAREAMDKIAVVQKESGAVPAYNNVDWVCSTGLFQLASVWFRLGDLERGNKAFEYACKLQNATGSWYGSYVSEDNPNEVNTYFPVSEISWANKYFLDALYYKNLTSFEEQASSFQQFISTEDGRYKCIEKLIKEAGFEKKKISVSDIGCGKGRYLRNLSASMPDNKYYAVDLSINVMRYFDDLHIEEKKQGSLTNIPFDDCSFDAVYTCEALEHAVDIKSAVKELCRVAKPGAMIAIIDKNKEKMGALEIEEWEQWFDEDELKNELSNYCSQVWVEKEISFDGNDANGLFYCWIGKKK